MLRSGAGALDFCVMLCSHKIHAISVIQPGFHGSVYFSSHMDKPEETVHVRLHIGSGGGGIFSSVTTVLLGWNWGFMIYTVAMVPISFYLAYTLPNHEGSIVSPMISSGVMILCFIVVHVICRYSTPFYEGKYPEIMVFYIYYFNTGVAFLILLIFSILFALEIRYMQRRLEEENVTLERVARTDPLTHLLNRRSMYGYMDQVLKREETFCLMMADIDDFKKINDTYGHDCGDEVLIAISDIISDCVREGDYVCRWGGEEILILVKTDLKQAVMVADRICHKVASNIIFRKGNEVRVTITIGISQYRDGMNISSMIEEADTKLYQGKNNGKNQVTI